jgi:hypothetical protein
MICTWSFGLSEVNEAEAAKLPELVPVSLFGIQPITITLDGQFVRRFRTGIPLDRVDTPLLDLSHDADVSYARQRGEVEKRQITTPWSLRGRFISDVLDRQP